MRLGTDLSQWGGVLLPGTVNCWKSKGVEYAIVQYSTLTKQHLDTIEAVGGVDMEAYVYLYWGTSPWGQTPADRTRLALAAGGNRINRLWLDAEDSTHPYNEAQLQECVRICEQAAMPTGIYTGRWWWVPNTSNSQAFKHLPLWDARYITSQPEADLSLTPTSMDGFVPYGGWTKAEVWQWCNTTNLCGHSVDLNVTPAVASWQPSKEQAIDALIRAGAVIVAGDQNLNDLSQVDKDSLRWIAATAEGS